MLLPPGSVVLQEETQSTYHRLLGDGKCSGDSGEECGRIHKAGAVGLQCGGDGAEP